MTDAAQRSAAHLHARHPRLLLHERGTADGGLVVRSACNTLRALIWADGSTMEVVTAPAAGPLGECRRYRPDGTEIPQDQWPRQPAE